MRNAQPTRCGAGTAGDPDRARGLAVVQTRRLAYKHASLASYTSLPLSPDLLDCARTRVTPRCKASDNFAVGANAPPSAKRCSSGREPCAGNNPTEKPLRVSREPDFSVRAVHRPASERCFSNPHTSARSCVRADRENQRLEVSVREDRCSPWQCPDAVADGACLLCTEACMRTDPGDALACLHRHPEGTAAHYEVQLCRSNSWATPLRCQPRRAH